MKHRAPKTHSPMTWKKALFIVMMVSLAVVVTIIVLSIYRIVVHPQSVFNNSVDAETSGTPQASYAPTGTGEDFDSDRVNILLLGMDSNEERLESDRVDFRTDTMLLVTIDFSNKQVDMVTIPRDSYVTVTNATGSLYKVNSAAYFGGGMCDSGFLNACDTISDVFGDIPVDYYVAVNMDGLRALVDAIGGLYYDVDVEVMLDGVILQPGYQLLDGEQVLAYCRVRKGIGTDIDRQERQQQLLVALFQQLKSDGKISDIPQIYKAVADMVYTNLSFEQICALAVFAQKFDDLDDIGRHVLQGEYHWAYGVYYYLLDQQAKADLVREIFGIDIGIDTEHDINYVLAQEDAKVDKEDNPTEEEPTEVPTPTEAPTSTDEATPPPSETPSAEVTPEPSAS